MVKLLYVEDNEDNVYMLGSRLKRHGFQIAVAADGKQGVAMAQSERPDLILMDLNLPIIDGWEATRRLKAAPQTRPIPAYGATSPSAPQRIKVMLAQKAAAVHRSRPQEFDRYVGTRIRERRIMLGLTQQQMAELIGVTYQQAHKYEKGINRVAAGRLYSIARALGVEVSYFFEGLQTAGRFMPSPQQRMLLDLARNYLDIPVREHREAILALARALAEGDGDTQAA